jgi:ABC-2 type transport system ATP-binding protein
MNIPLIIDHLSIAYRSAWTGTKTTVIDDISFTIHPGQAVGYLGINGAGKTSTIKAILGLIKQGSGSITLFGTPSSKTKARALIGYLPEQPYWYENLTVEETISFYGALFDLSADESLKRAHTLLERLNLSTKLHAKIKTLSKGLMQRVGLIQALINEPKLLILDEPFSGLDPLARKLFKDILLEQKQKGVAMMISSHILPDIEALCDRAIIIHNQRIQADCDMQTLSEKHQSLETLFTSIAGPVTP